MNSFPVRHDVLVIYIVYYKVEKFTLNLSGGTSKQKIVNFGSCGCKKLQFSPCSLPVSLHHVHVLLVFGNKMIVLGTCACFNNPSINPHEHFYFYVIIQLCCLCSNGCVVVICYLRYMMHVRHATCVCNSNSSHTSTLLQLCKHICYTLYVVVIFWPCVATFYWTVWPWYGIMGNTCIVTGNLVSTARSKIQLMHCLM